MPSTSPHRAALLLLPAPLALLLFPLGTVAWVVGIVAAQGSARAARVAGALHQANAVMTAALCALLIDNVVRAAQHPQTGGLYGGLQELVDAAVLGPMGAGGILYAAALWWLGGAVRVENQQRRTSVLGVVVLVLAGGGLTAMWVARANAPPPPGPTLAFSPEAVTVALPDAHLEVCFDVPERATVRGSSQPSTLRGAPSLRSEFQVWWADSVIATYSFEFPVTTNVEPAWPAAWTKLSLVNDSVALGNGVLTVWSNTDPIAAQRFRTNIEHRRAPGVR